MKKLICMGFITFCFVLFAGGKAAAYESKQVTVSNVASEINLCTPPRKIKKHIVNCANLPASPSLCQKMQINVLSNNLVRLRINTASDEKGIIRVDYDCVMGIG